MISKNTEEFGDYQTPQNFTDYIVDLLIKKYSINPSYVFEPTMGHGNFLISSLMKFKELVNVFGVDINSQYINDFKQNIQDSRAECFIDNIFTFDFGLIKKKMKNKNILFIGNPPWVTNTVLSTINSYNVPLKENFKGEKGFDAITGKGNFDICEYIILDLLFEFRNYSGSYFSFLCKPIVAKNIVRDLKKYNFKLDLIDAYEFNANKIFSINCNAILFVCRMSDYKSIDVCDVYDINNFSNKIRSYGWYNEKFISNVEDYKLVEELDGKCQFQWRQGVKHDCSSIMELTKENNHFKNGISEIVADSRYIYPLIKSSGFKNAIINSFKKYVIITQTKVREDTNIIKDSDTKLWDYLSEHKADFDKRKSSIYKNTPPFSIFGIGDYSFARYKIGISGFYKEPFFSLVYGEKPAMMDDTCYFIGTEDYFEALILLAVLNNKKTINFIKAIYFEESKRPITKDILQRLDIQKMLELFNYNEIIEYIRGEADIFIDSDKISQFIKKLSLSE